MRDWLLYWKFYWTEVKEDPSNFNDDWHTAQERFSARVKSGDSLWAVVTGGAEYPDEWRLLQRIIARQVKHEPDLPRPYHIVGDSKKSEKYDIAGQSDLTPLLYQLEFVSGKRISASGRLIGRSLQTIRPLTEGDGLLLEQYARKLERL